MALANGLTTNTGLLEINLMGLGGSIAVKSEAICAAFITCFQVHSLLMRLKNKNTALLFSLDITCLLLLCFLTILVLVLVATTLHHHHLLLLLLDKPDVEEAHLAPGPPPRPHTRPSRHPEHEHRPSHRSGTLLGWLVLLWVVNTRGKLSHALACRLVVASCG